MHLRSQARKKSRQYNKMLSIKQEMQNEVMRRLHRQKVSIHDDGVQQTLQNLKAIEKDSIFFDRNFEKRKKLIIKKEKDLQNMMQQMQQVQQSLLQSVELDF